MSEREWTLLEEAAFLNDLLSAYNNPREEPPSWADLRVVCRDTSSMIRRLRQALAARDELIGELAERVRLARKEDAEAWAEAIGRRPSVCGFLSARLNLADALLARVEEMQR